MEYCQNRCTIFLLSWGPSKSMHKPNIEKFDPRCPFRVVHASHSRCVSDGKHMFRKGLTYNGGVPRPGMGSVRIAIDYNLDT